MTTIELRNQAACRRINQRACRDTAVSARGRGILFALAWLPEHWRGSRNDLRRAVAPELGRSAFLHTVRELKAHGLITVEPLNRPKGQSWRLHLHPAAGGPVNPPGADIGNDTVGAMLR